MPVAYELEREQNIVKIERQLALLGIPPVLPKEKAVKPHVVTREIKERGIVSRSQPKRVCNEAVPEYKEPCPDVLIKVGKKRARALDTYMEPSKRSKESLSKVDKAFATVTLEDLAVFDENECESQIEVEEALKVHKFTLKLLYCRVVRERDEPVGQESRFTIVKKGMMKSTGLAEMLCEAVLNAVLKYEKQFLQDM